MPNGKHRILSPVSHFFSRGYHVVDHSSHRPPFIHSSYVISRNPPPWKIPSECLRMQHNEVDWKLPVVSGGSSPDFPEDKNRQRRSPRVESTRWSPVKLQSRTLRHPFNRLVAASAIAPRMEAALTQTANLSIQSKSSYCDNEFRQHITGSSEQTTAESIGIAHEIDRILSVCLGRCVKLSLLPLNP